MFKIITKHDGCDYNSKLRDLQESINQYSSQSSNPTNKSSPLKKTFFKRFGIVFVIVFTVTSGSILFWWKKKKNEKQLSKNDT
jgi:hypothetical protein